MPTLRKSKAVEKFNKAFDEAFVEPLRDSGTLTHEGDFRHPRDIGTFGGCAVDVKEKDDEYLIDAAVPGFHKDNVKVRLVGNNLTLQGDAEVSHTQERETWHVRELSRGSFQRTLTLPSDIDPDSISAKWDDGLLHLHIRRKPREQRPEPRMINIS